jgi:hypothetical protein
VLDELPSLEFAATAVALVLTWRAVVLARGGPGLSQRRRRAESARARDLIGLVILIGAVLYAVRAERASTWFLAASGVAVVAQLLGLYFRAAAAHARKAASPSIEVELADEDDDDEPNGCPSCGHGKLIEIEDAARLLGGLHELTPVVVAVCPNCGTISGHVEDPTKIPIGPAHGTALRQSLSGEDQEALEEPAEHDG